MPDTDREARPDPARDLRGDAQADPGRDPGRDPGPIPVRDGGFLARWSGLKQAARRGEAPPAHADSNLGLADLSPEPGAAAGFNASEGPAEPAGESAPEATLTDADMPPLESLDGHSDYSGFLSPGVSAGLRRQALARLFHSPHLNVTDGLDDFDEDFTTFRPLGGLVTADMRHHAERAARRLAGLAGEGTDSAQPGADVAQPDADAQVKADAVAALGTPLPLPDKTPATLTPDPKPESKPGLDGDPV
jgi:hypothetical protein